MRATVGSLLVAQPIPGGQSPYYSRRPLAGTSGAAPGGRRPGAFRLVTPEGPTPWSLSVPTAALADSAEGSGPLARWQSAWSRQGDEGNGISSAPRRGDLTDSESEDPGGRGSSSGGDSGGLRIAPPLPFPSSSVARAVRCAIRRFAINFLSQVGLSLSTTAKEPESTAPCFTKNLR